MDFHKLRTAGLHHLQELAGHVWTDHNLHDPGITTLEQLCYALTDLYYRLGYSVPDLLALPASGDPYRSLYSPAEILTTQPVTIADLRRLVLDTPGVRNAYVAKTRSGYEPPVFLDPVDQSISVVPPLREMPTVLPIRGLYDVFLVQEAGYKPDAVRRAVFRKLHRNRNLGEDINRVVVLPTDPVALRVEIELAEEVHLNDLLRNIYREVSDYVSPRVPFHSLAEMLAMGWSVEDIFTGPRLTHGFVTAEDLERHPIRRVLMGSDLIHLIMDQPGVAAIREFRMVAGSGQEDEWLLELRGRETAYSFDWKRSQFRFFRQGLEIKYDLQPPAPPAPAKVDFVTTANDIRPPAGRYRHPEKYYSVQRQFPEVYGIGPRGLAPSASPQRQAQAKQFKAYLAFFDQLLADYFGQLAGAKELFDVHSPPGPTYFQQSLNGDDGVPDFAAIYRSTPPGPERLEEPSLLQSMLPDKVLEDWLGAAFAEAPPPGTSADRERYNRLYNHLLARFGESIADYALIKYGGDSTASLLEDKRLLLRKYPFLSSRRAGGFDYTTPLPRSLDVEDVEAANVSGFQLRVCLKLGLDPGAWIPLRPLTDHAAETASPFLGGLLNLEDLFADMLSQRETTPETSARSISGETSPPAAEGTDPEVPAGTESGAVSFDERFYLVEHILFRPAPGDSFQDHPLLVLPTDATEDRPPLEDPYSLQISVVFPTTLAPFDREAFRALAVKTVREEAPAHLSVRIHWLETEAEWAAFDRAYFHWINELQKRSADAPATTD